MSLPPDGPRLSGTGTRPTLALVPARPFLRVPGRARYFEYYTAIFDRLRFRLDARSPSDPDFFGMELLSIVSTAASARAEPCQE